MRHQEQSRRGSALLAVLWLSAALSAIAFSMSITVRTEAERAGTALDDLRSYYLASAGVEKAAMELLWTATGSAQLIPKNAAWVDYQFPSGVAHVEIIPEAAKMDINRAPQGDLLNLMISIGIDSAHADAIAAGIMNRRSEVGVPSFQGSQASFEEIEELLSVRGVTPDIFYGTWTPAADNPMAGSGLVRRAGLIDCLTVYGQVGGGGRGVNPAMPGAMGTGNFGARGMDMSQLMMQGGTVITFRATAHLRLANGQFSDMRRTVGAEVRYLIGPQYDYRTQTYVSQQSDTAYQVLRWYNTAWSN